MRIGSGVAATAVAGVALIGGEVVELHLRLAVDQAHLAAAEKVSSLAADSDHADPFIRIFVHKGLRRFDDVRVKRARQTFVGGHQNDQIIFIAASVEQRVRKIVADARAQTAEHLRHFLRERSCGSNPILCSLELRRRDHFHRFGYLLRVFNRLDASAHI